MITREEFHRLFRGRIWNRIRESIVPFEPPTPAKTQFLDELYDDIRNNRYHPGVPREYIVQDKHNAVARIVPTFDYRDACVFLYCVRLLEPDIAVNRVDGTFGGWSMGNLIHQQEQAEIEQLEYDYQSSFNPYRWVEHWREYQRRAFEFSQTGEFECFLEFDISNFYDTISQTRLERSIRNSTNTDLSDVIDLLFYFLNHWNRPFNLYASTNVGIPQEERLDCSRLLANFYLQPYDSVIERKCNERGCRFLRYADDQLIFAPNMDVANGILFEASKELFRINLNINSSKVKRFENRHAFSLYWGFDIFELLGNTDNSTNLNLGIQMYFDRKAQGIEFKEFSVLRRILNLDFSLLDSHLRHRLFAELLSPDFLAASDYRILTRIRERIEDPNELDQILEGLIHTVRFNSFHYHLLRYYGTHRANDSIDQITQRIEEIRIHTTE